MRVAALGGHPPSLSVADGGALNRCAAVAGWDKHVRPPLPFLFTPQRMRTAFTPDSHPLCNPR